MAGLAAPEAELRELETDGRRAIAERIKTARVRRPERVEIVEYGSCQEIAQRSKVAVVGTAQCRQVARAVALVDDRRVYAEPDE